jgi:hypothetical protein
LLVLLILAVSGDWLIHRVILPRVVDYGAIQREIETQASQSLNFQFRMRDLDIRLWTLHGVRVRFNVAQARSSDTAKPLFKADTLDLYFRPLPLIFGGKKELAAIQLDRATLNLDERERWPTLKKSAAEPPVVIRDTEFLLKRYSLTYRKYSHALAHTFSVTGDRFRLKHLQAEGKPLELALDGKLAGAKPIGRMLLKARMDPDVLAQTPSAEHLQKASLRLQNLELANLRAFLTDFELLEKHHPANDWWAAGQVRRLELAVRQPKPGEHVFDAKIDSRRPTRVRIQDIRFNPGPGTLKLSGVLRGETQLDDLKLAVRSGGFNLNGQGRIQLASQPLKTRLDLRLKGEALPLDFLQGLPGVNPTLRLAKTLGGRLSLPELRLSGTLAEPLPYGKVYLHDVSALSGTPAQHQPVLHGLNGEVSLAGPVIQVPKLNGRLDGRPFSLQAEFNQKTRQSQGRLQTAPMSLRSLERFAERLARLSNVKAERLTGFGTLLATGLLQADVGWRGSLETPRLQGQVRLKDVALLAAPPGHSSQEVLASLPSARVLFQGDQAVLQPALLRLDPENALQLKATAHLPAGGYQAAISSERLDGALLSRRLRRVAQLANLAVPQELLSSELSGNLQLNLLARAERLASSPFLSGSIQMSGGQLRYAPMQQLTLRDINGLIRVAGERLQLENLRFRPEDNAPVSLSGQLSSTTQTGRLSLSTNGLDLARLHRQVLPKLPGNVSAQLQQAGLLDLGGRLSGALTVALQPNQSIKLLSGQLSAQQVRLRHAQLPEPVQMAPVHLSVRPGGVLEVSPTSGKLGTLGFHFSGAVQPSGRQPDYRVHLATDPIPVAHLRDHPAFWHKLLGQPLPTLWNTAGAFQAVADVTPQRQQAVLSLQHAGASWGDSPMPVHEVNGRLRWSGEKGRLALETPLTARYGNASVAVNKLEIGLKPGVQPVHMDVSGRMTPLEANQLVGMALFGEPTDADLRVPFSLTVAGTVGSLTGDHPANRLDARLALNVDSQEAAILPWFFREARRNVPDQASQNIVGGTPSRRLPVETHWQAVIDASLEPSRLVLKPSWLRLEDENAQLSFSGALEHPFIPERQALYVQLKTSKPVELSKIAPVAEPEPAVEQSAVAAEESKLVNPSSANPRPIDGKVDVDLTLAAAQGEARVNGAVDLQGLHLDPIHLNRLDATLRFEDTTASLEVPTFQVPGVDVGLRAEVPDLTQFPIRLQSVEISGPLFSVADFTRFLQEDLTEKVVTPVQASLALPVQRSQANMPRLPFEVREARVALDEAIFNNIILQGLSSRLTLFPNGMLILDDLAFSTAGGKVQGRVSNNSFEQNYTAVTLNTESVSANALSRALLNLSNQIFGNLSGSIQITTRGETDADMMRNTNGVMRFRIQDGRLPEITRVETLLTAANIIRGGVLGLNLNNLFRTLNPFHTEYFAELYGNFEIAEGVVYTNDLVSDGRDLDLLIKGSIRLVDGVGNLRVIGTMSQDVSGILGPIGKFSVGRVVNYIPGLGFIPGTKNRRGIISFIPGVGYIPGFGGPAEHANRFQVRIVGPLDDPASAKAVEWLSQ